MKGWQKTRDKRARRRAERSGRPATILDQRDIDAAIRGGVDHAEGVSELLRREGRQEVERLTRKFPARYATVGRLVLEGEVRPGRLREDLGKVLDELEDHTDELSGEKLQQHRINITQVKAALKDKRLLRGEGVVFRRLKEYAEHLNRLDEQLVEVGYRAAETGKSRHVPWLVRHADARAGERSDAVLTEVGEGRRARGEAARQAEQRVGAIRPDLRRAEESHARVLGEITVYNRGLSDASREWRGANAQLKRAQRAGDDRAISVAEARLGAADSAVRDASEAARMLRPVLERAEGDVQAGRRALGEAELGARQARSEQRQYRARTKGRLEKRVPWMVDKAGREIREEDLPGLAAEHGVDIDGIAWISQRSFELSERGAHYQRGNLNARPWVAGKKRTGEATRQGTIDLSRDSVLEDAFRRRSILDAVDANLRMLNSIGAVGLRVDPDTGMGGFRTVQDAKRANAELRFDKDGNERPWVPELEVLSLMPFFKSRRELARVKERVTTAADMDEFSGWLLKDYESARLGKATDQIEGGGGEPGGPYILVPRVALEQAARHARNLGPGNFGKAAQVFTHRFRETVLL